MAHEKNNKGSAIPTWMYVVGACVALALLCLYKFRPQLFGSNGSTWLLLGIGLLFAEWTALNIRSGTAALIYTSYKRSVDATGFWTAIVVEALVGGAAIVIALGALLHMWPS